MQNERLMPNLQTGLTAEQVRLQKERGRQNTPPEPITKPVSRILRDNICTLFNLFNVLIAIALMLVGAWSNLVFILVIALNTAIGIAQELKAKSLVDKLSLLSAPHAAMLRDGKQEQLPVEELVQDDLLLLESGQQVCADAVVLDGSAEANEALLTGESDPVPKTQGDQLLSGSSIISGRCRARVEHVGGENYATHIAQQAKKQRRVHSELLHSMKRVTKFTGYLIIPLGILLFIEAFWLRSDGVQESVVSTAAALLGMLPKGLVLLISISLAVGVGRLAKKKVLVQELFALETLAHVDTLCLDKTGTITQGKMRVEDVLPLSDIPCDFDRLMSSFLTQADDNNATFQAMQAHFPAGADYPAKEKIPFSSQRKWSGMQLAGAGWFVVGAPERLGCTLPLKIQARMNRGERVLVVGITSHSVSADKPLPEVTPLRAVLLSDLIRPNAEKTLAYFRKEGVDLKVISGDNPASVSAIAKRAGLPGAEKYIDMSTVQTAAEVARAAKEYAVFGRVSPAQKKQLVQALQKQGRSVAMTGDGVNDILALREADCSIAIAEGSDAARQASQLVLLDSDFGSLPAVLAEGRRVVNNITRVAGIFFVKTVYSVLLSVFCMLCNIPFPFIPIQITLIDLAIEGYPSFFMSFEPDGRKITGRFLSTALGRAFPNAAAILLCIIAGGLLAPPMGIADGQLTLALYLLIGTVGVQAVLKACWPFNKLRVFLCATMTAGYYAAVLLFHKLLQLPLPSTGALGLFATLAVTSLMLERLLTLAGRKLSRKQKGQCPNARTT